MTAKRDQSTKNPLWGGRFHRGPDELMTAINASVAFDQRLAAVDIRASLAHVKMLADQGIITKRSAAEIRKGLRAIAEEVAAGKFRFTVALEDVHMNIEHRLAERIGSAAGRMHTARSRNDQVATDLRLWVRDRIDELDGAAANLQRAFLVQAEGGGEMIMPGFTHLQMAQPITWGFHMLAYVEMLARDRGRLADARDRLNECPLGAAALAGTSFDIDRSAVAQELGFRQPAGNALDAVSDRDFVLEFMAAAAILATHLSRFAEEVVIWSCGAFEFVRLSDAFTTGSSIMPQKRNPDAAELVRAKAGRVFGALLALLTVMKGLPLAYAKDMQEDKEPLFDVVDTLALVVPATTALVRDLQPNAEAMAAAAQRSGATATDLADWLVSARNMPFREAHRATGMVVKLAERNNVELQELSLEQLQSVVPEIDAAGKARLNVTKSVGSRRSFGGTAPVRVRERIKYWQKRLDR